MRIDSGQVLETGGFNVKARKGTALDKLKEGETVRVKVLSSDEKSAVLKTPDGQVIRTRLTPGVSLTAGQDATLEVTAKTDGEIFLSVVPEDVTENAGGSRAFSEPARNFEDKSLSSFAETLSELNIPVRESTARAMRELLTAHPGMTVEEAAFLASNNVPSDSPLINAALALITDGVKTDELVGGLLALIKGGEPGGSEQTVQAVQTGAEQLVQGGAPEGTDTAAALPASSVELPLTGLFTKLADITALTAADAGNDAFYASAGIESAVLENDTFQHKVIISQGDTKMQDTMQAAMEIQFKDAALPQKTEQASVFSGDEPARFTEETRGAGGVPVPDGQERAGAAVREQKTAQSVPEKPAVIPEQKTAVPEQNAEKNRIAAAIAGALEEIPEFKGTPPSVLERFSNALLRTAQDNAGLSRDAAARLPEMLDKLFFELEKNDKGAGARLRQAKEELFVRLSLIEETVSAALHPAKNEMVAQTRRLIDHVKLLNSIDQFIYMQMPVRIGEERRTADMYVYKRKGGKRVDAADVNILLSLDLEYMGHWESLVNIKGKDVSLRMEVSGEGEKEYISANTVRLHELLSEAGFKLGGVNITHSMAETTPLTALSALDRYQKGRGNAVDFKI